MRSLTGPSYTLVQDTGGAVSRIAASNGTSCAITPGVIDGELVRDGLSFYGWATDPTGEAERLPVLAFAGKRLVFATTTGSPPPRGSRAAGDPSREKAGFLFGLTAGVVDESETLRVFAVKGERCTELRASTGS
jgi:hypothetical protein